MARRPLPNRQVRGAVPTFASLQPAGLVAPKRTAAAERAQQMNISGQQRTAALQSQAAADLQNRLNQMTSMAFNSAAAQAKVEGEAYGVQNAPSADLIQNANTKEWEYDARGQPVPGDTWTVFGRAARSAALDQMYLDLSVDSKIAMGGITKAAYDQFGAPIKAPTDVENELNKLVDDTKNAAMQISPVLASKLYANLRIEGHNALNAFNTKYLTHQGKVRKAVAQRSIVLEQDAVVTAIEAGNPELIKSIYARAEHTAVVNGLDFKAFDATWDKHVKKALVSNGVMRAVEMGQSAVIDHINNNHGKSDFKGIGTLEQSLALGRIWQHMDDDTKTDFIKALDDAHKIKTNKPILDRSAWEAREKHRVAGIAKEFAIASQRPLNLGDMDDANATLRASAMDAALNRLGHSEIAQKTRTALLKTRDLQPDIALELERRKAEGTLEYEYVERLMELGLLQGEHAAKAMADVAAITNESGGLRLARDHIRRTLKVVEREFTSADTQQADRAALMKFNEYIDMITNWLTDGQVGENGKAYGFAVGDPVNERTILDIARQLVGSDRMKKDRADDFEAAVSELRDENKYPGIMTMIGMAPPGSDPEAFLQSKIVETESEYWWGLGDQVHVINENKRTAARKWLNKYRAVFKKYGSDAGLDIKAKIQTYMGRR